MYLDPVINAKTLVNNGVTRLVFEFNGDAGEPTVTREYMLYAGRTANDIRQWVGEVINELDQQWALASAAGLQPGRTVARLGKVAAAKEIWQRKKDAYMRLKNLDLAGGVATQLATMKADLESTYQAGFEDV